jgi:hypothetical protein
VPRHGLAPGDGTPGDWVRASSTRDFLDSIGVNTHVDQGVPVASVVGPINYLGIRSVRDGGNRPEALLALHRQTGARLAVSAYARLDVLLATARRLAAADALLAVEGPNEPNNFPFVYKGRKGGGTDDWGPVAELQRDIYGAVAADPVLSGYPVFSVSETGAQIQDFGLQFLTVPARTGEGVPAGTRYADYANVHNYVSATFNGYVDNQAWSAASPENVKGWDGLHGNFGVTWRRSHRGYGQAQLDRLPRVTTETGWDSKAGGEKRQAVVLLNTLLGQFKRGYRYTFIYQLRDGEGGDQPGWGLFRGDSTPKLAATAIRRLTTLLADAQPNPAPGGLAYRIDGATDAVHDMLLQNSDGTFHLVVWAELADGRIAPEVALQGAPGSCAIFDPTSSDEPVGDCSGQARIRLDLSDHPLVLRLRPPA